MTHKLQYVPLPNVEAALVQLLQNDTQAMSQWVFTASTTLIGYNDANTQKWLHINRVGGKPTWPMPDRALIQFSVYCPKKSDAHDISQAARAIVYVNSATQIAPDTVLCGVADYQGLAYLPDMQGISRYVFGLQVWAKPVAANIGPVVSDHGI